MFRKRDEYLALDRKGLAICGKYVPHNDGVHVGIFWNWEGEQRVAHFIRDNTINIHDVTNANFSDYYFSPLPDFKEEVIDTLTALAENISTNALNNFKLSITSAVFNGGKFESVTGNFLGGSGAERFINCGVFVLALLNTVDYQLLDWDTWPNTDPANLTYLTDWLTANAIPADQWPDYYRQSRVVRGKHIIVSPSTASKPSPFVEADPLATAFVDYIKAIP